MTMAETSRVCSRAARDLVALAASRESFGDELEAFAKRRAGVWALETEESPERYWPSLALSLAPVAPLVTMPMAGLIEAGVTLEGGAKGLRGLFTSKPSGKERKRVLKVASLAARVMELVAGADEALTDDERRGMAMVMASFGLTPEEAAEAKPTGKLAPEQLQVYGELDARVRRELVRGAWQLALGHDLTPREEEVVRTIAQRLDLGEQSATLRAEVEARQARQSELAATALELLRHPARLLPEPAASAAVEHLVQAASPAPRAGAMRALGALREPGRPERLALLDRRARVQALALAWSSLVGADPSHFVTLRARAELGAVASAAGAEMECDEALGEVDRFLFRRVLEVVRGEAPRDHPAEPERAPATPSSVVEKVAAATESLARNKV